MAPGRVSPARRQAPHPRRDQFNRVAGGIAEIEGPTTPTPGFLVFDRDLVLSEPLPPGAEADEALLTQAEALAAEAMALA